jgi:hypothetical protein
VTVDRLGLGLQRGEKLGDTGVAQWRAVAAWPGREGVSAECSAFVKELVTGCQATVAATKAPGPPAIEQIQPQPADDEAA